MNLLEHYIDEIISEEKVKNPEDGNEYYRIRAIVDCYGQKELRDRLFSIEEWEQVKRKGYFVG